QVLRRAHTALADVKVEDGTVPLDPVSGDCLELIAEFEPGDASEFGLSLRRSPDGEEETRLIYRQQERTLSIDRFHSTKDPEQYTYPKGEPLPLAPGENLKLQIFIDRSVIEIFANDRLCLTTRIYPTRDDSQGIAAFAVGTATLRRLDAWQLAPATPTT
ncbi:MAG: GH32 C-terminal domain-containing protein, partial [Lentisphaeria bacterium]|nr:GH32 C-terminal domain-containing protein [Lentisphaeria bacterium]